MPKNERRNISIMVKANLLLLVLICTNWTDATYLLRASAERIPESCEQKKYVQIVTAPGCDVHKINNSYCQGQCRSGYISLSNYNYVSVKASCSGCKATGIETRRIILNCQNNETMELNVEIFKSCKCMRSSCAPSTIPIPKDMQIKLEKNNKINRHSCRDICQSCRKVKKKLKSLTRNMKIKDDAWKNKLTLKKHEIRYKRKVLLVKMHCTRCKKCRMKKKIKMNLVSQNWWSCDLQLSWSNSAIQSCSQNMLLFPIKIKQNVINGSLSHNKICLYTCDSYRISTKNIYKQHQLAIEKKSQQSILWVISIYQYSIRFSCPQTNRMFKMAPLECNLQKQSRGTPRKSCSENLKQNFLERTCIEVFLLTIFHATGTDISLWVLRNFS